MVRHKPQDKKNMKDTSCTIYWKNSLTTQVKKYFQKWFSKTVMQKKCDQYALARSLNLTVPNSFRKQSLSNYSNCFPLFDYHESAVRSGWFSQSTVTHIQTWDVFFWKISSAAVDFKHHNKRRNCSNWAISSFQFCHNVFNCFQ